jgi:hypothetical protein
MRFINTFKLFESNDQDHITKYLNKLNISYDDITDIFINLTDIGFILKVKMLFIDENGNEVNNHSESFTPILRINIKAYNDFDIHTINDIFNSINKINGIAYEHTEDIKFSLKSQSIKIDLIFKKEKNDIISKKDLSKIITDILDSFDNIYKDTREWGIGRFIIEDLNGINSKEHIAKINNIFEEKLEENKIKFIKIDNRKYTITDNKGNVVYLIEFILSYSGDMMNGKFTKLYIEPRIEQNKKYLKP